VLTSVRPLRSVWESATTTGGSASSLENNNVFGIEPQMYLTTGEQLDDSSGAVGKLDPATLAVTTVAVAIIAVAGTATCLYYENLIGMRPFPVRSRGSDVFTTTAVNLQPTAASPS
jgi:hypothetical protein